MGSIVLVDLSISDRQTLILCERVKVNKIGIKVSVLCFFVVLGKALLMDLCDRYLNNEHALLYVYFLHLSKQYFK